MPEFGLRDLGAIVPGTRFAEPEMQRPLGPAEASTALGPRSAETIFVTDRMNGADVLGLSSPLAVLAALAAHAGTRTPLAIGLLGPAGCGKTTALRSLLRLLEESGGPSFVEKIHVARLDATRLDGPAVVALADALHASLAAPFPGLVAEATFASQDPWLAKCTAYDALDAARQKLGAERDALEETNARRARLAEAVLFDSAGTQIDTYVRANRSRFENRLAGFGLTGDPVTAFKELVSRASDGLRSRIGFGLETLWAFKGQATLLVVALLLALAGIGLGYAEERQAVWLGFMRGNESMRAAADWIAANIGYFETLRRAAFIGAALAMGVNLLRALRVLLPVLHGSALLRSDLALHKRLVDGQLGHQTRRVESLEAEVEVLARRAADAERRVATGHGDGNAPVEPSPFHDDAQRRHAEGFIAEISRATTRPHGASVERQGPAFEMPGRIVVALDGLDSIPAPRARDVLAAAHSALGPGFVLLVAADPGRLTTSLEAGVSELERWIQVPFQIAGLVRPSDLAALVRDALDPPAEEPPRANVPCPVEGLLDEPIGEAEAALLAELAPLAGSTARAVKRFVNLYRLARTQCPEHRGMLALMLALDAGGTEAEKAALKHALSSPKAQLDIDLLSAGPRLATALSAVQALSGDETLAGARRAAEWARLFSFHAPG